MKEESKLETLAEVLGGGVFGILEGSNNLLSGFTGLPIQNTIYRELITKTSQNSYRFGEAIVLIGAAAHIYSF